MQRSSPKPSDSRGELRKIGAKEETLNHQILEGNYENLDAQKEAPRPQKKPDPRGELRKLGIQRNPKRRF